MESKFICNFIVSGLPVVALLLCLAKKCFDEQNVHFSDRPESVF